MSKKAPISRGGHRHLQIGRMLDIDLISEPPTPPPPRCLYPKCGNLCRQGAGSDSQLAGVSGCHIFVPASHVPPPKGIGQRSKVVILPTTANQRYRINSSMKNNPFCINLIIIILQMFIIKTKTLCCLYLTAHFAFLLKVIAIKFLYHLLQALP